MLILDRIQDGIVKYVTETGRRPTRVYLGHIEEGYLLCDLVDVCTRSVYPDELVSEGMNIPSTFTVFGLDVYIVKDTDHHFYVA